MTDLHYNYVVFNSVENSLHPSPNGYYSICMEDLKNLEGVRCLYSPVCEMPLLIRYLYTIHNSVKVNKKINLPFKNIWYPFFFKDSFNEKKPLCIVLLKRLPISYLNFLKKKYPDCKIVLTYRDLRKITEVPYPELPDNPILDLQLTIDAHEAKQYGWEYFDEIESKIDVPLSTDYPESDVFFAGKAKDRLPRLMEAYDIFMKAGLRCKYYLTEVPVENRIPLPGIEYSDNFMPYSEMLYHTVNSRCVLEINQAEAVGYTSRFLEAVMFNKRLITDNQDVKKSKFYTPNNILCIKSVSEISADFVKNNEPVEYNYNNEFSPIHLIEQIDRELVKRYGGKQ